MNPHSQIRATARSSAVVSSASPIRVVHLITGLGLGGAQRQLYQLVQANSTIQHHVVSMTDRGAYGELLERLNTPVSCLGMPSRKISWNGPWKLLQVLHREQPQILQTWLNHADLLGLMVWLCHWGWGGNATRLLWNLRSCYGSQPGMPKLSRQVLSLCAWFSRLPYGIVVNSEAVLRSHREAGFRARRWQIIPNGIDTDKFHPNKELRGALQAQYGAGPLIGHVGSFNSLKDHSLLLSSFLLLGLRVTQAQFFLCGMSGVEDTNPDLQALIPEAIRSRVHLLGAHDSAQLLPGLDVFALSSRVEGSSNVIAEALACGVPCVSMDVGDSREIIGPYGTVIQKRDPQAFSEALMEAIHPAKRKQWPPQALHERIVQRYSMQLMQKRYVQFYHKACGIPVGAAEQAQNLSWMDESRPIH